MQRLMVSVVRETFRGICERRPEFDYWHCIKFDWMSTSLFMHFWRSSSLMVCCFWRVFLRRWVLGWWPKDSMVCLDLPRTIFTTSTALFETGVVVCSPWINNPHHGQKNGIYFYSYITAKKVHFWCFHLVFLAISTVYSRLQPLSPKHMPLQCQRKL